MPKKKSRKSQEKNNIGVYSLKKDKNRPCRDDCYLFSVIILIILTGFLLSLETRIISEKLLEWSTIKSLANISETIEIKNSINDRIDGAVFREKNFLGQQNYHEKNWEINDFSSNSSSVLVYDLSNNQVLFEKNPSQKLPIASITKLMSILIIEEKKKDKDQWLEFIDTDINIEGKKNMFLVGEEFKLDDLESAALISSSNEAISLLSRFFEKEINDSFVDTMNEKAEQIGLKNTNFSNPVGFDGNNLSTAYDVFALAKYILEYYPRIFDISRLSEKTVSSRAGRSVILKNTNFILLQEFSAIFGSKTGNTDMAQGCMILGDKIKKDNLIFILLGSKNRTQEMKNLIKWTETAYNF
ncbi:MAG: serine hydrolase [Candidatus Paceibacterota bacterium]|jgi:D-alanyl-D-alanine carboxypeptidase (penicillin-binding protein 5/6)